MVVPELMVVQERVEEQGGVKKEHSHRHDAGTEGLQRTSLRGKRGEAATATLRYRPRANDQLIQEHAGLTCG